MSEHDADPAQVIAAKQNWMVQECERRHRVLDRQVHEWQVLLHGEKGDNGLKSMVVELKTTVKQLQCAVDKLNKKMTVQDGRMWKLALTIATASAFVGGGASSLMNVLLK